MAKDSSRSRVAFLALISMTSVSGWAVEPATIANQGAGSQTACASCHGKDGSGQGAFPRLAGMNAAYLLKQLNDFASGSRDNAIMKPIVATLSSDDRKAIADYFSELSIPKTRAAIQPASAVGIGKQLATRGAWSKGVPACVQCHGPGGVGVGSSFPALAGQSSSYITAQLQAWQKGTRKNDPLELMRHLASKLSADEVSAVSEWFARQPALPSAVRP